MEKRGGRATKGRLGIALLVCLGAAVIFPSLLAGAATEAIDITIPIDTVVRTKPGTTKVLATEPVPDLLIGEFCVVSAQAENQGSVHPGNHLVIQSGTSLVLVEGVEDEAGAVTTAEGFLELGEEVIISLLMGPDGVFSAGMSVTFACTLEPPGTTVPDQVAPTEVTTTTADDSVIAETTTTTVPTEVLPTEVPTEVLPTEVTTTADRDQVAGTRIATTTVTVTGDDEVAGVEELPFTGVDPVPLAVMGLSLLCVGGVFISEARSSR